MRIKYFFPFIFTLSSYSPHQKEEVLVFKEADYPLISDELHIKREIVFADTGHVNNYFSFLGLATTPPFSQTRVLRSPLDDLIQAFRPATQASIIFLGGGLILN